MRYYLDFEAARFSNKIISVGCITESGETFYTLVKSCKLSKIDKFITSLTGITREMLADAPSPDTAFLKLYDFIMRHDDGERPEYYVYGNSDIEFLRATLKCVNEIHAVVCVQALIGGLIDYSPEVSKAFGREESIGLRKAYLVVHDELNDFVQEHNALTDAMMLRDVVMKLPEACSAAEKERLAAIPTQPKPYPKKKTVENPLWTEWLDLPKSQAWICETHASADSWKVRVCTINHTIYFNSVEDAALWLVRFNFVPKMSPKKQQDMDKVMKIVRNKKFSNFMWTIKEGA